MAHPHMLHDVLTCVIWLFHTFDMIWRNLHTHKHTFICICIYLYIFVCVHTYIYIYEYVHIYYTYMHAYVFIHIIPSNVWDHSPSTAAIISWPYSWCKTRLIHTLDPTFTCVISFHTHKSPIHTQKSPIHTQKSPIHTQKSPVHTGKSLMHTQKGPISPINHVTEHSNARFHFTLKRALQTHSKEPYTHSKGPYKPDQSCHRTFKCVKSFIHTCQSIQSHTWDDLFICIVSYV